MLISPRNKYLGILSEAAELHFPDAIFVSNCLDRKYRKISILAGGSG